MFFFVLSPMSIYFWKKVFFFLVHPRHHLGLFTHDGWYIALSICHHCQVLNIAIITFHWSDQPACPSSLSAPDTRARLFCSALPPAIIPFSCNELRQYCTKQILLFKEIRSTKGEDNNHLKQHHSFKELREIGKKTLKGSKPVVMDRQCRAEQTCASIRSWKRWWTS